MLDRTTKQPSADRRRDRNARHRRRCKAGRIVPLDFDIGAAVLAMLIRTHWLDERAAGDRRAIGRALPAMLHTAELALCSTGEVIRRTAADFAAQPLTGQTLLCRELPSAADRNAPAWSGLSPESRAKPKLGPMGPISALEWWIVPTRIMKNMPAMQTIIRRSASIGPKNTHGEIQ